MLMLGDLDLNSVPRCTETLKEAVKLTMLKHEVVFRKQVHELHRLYGLQESLMKDLTYPRHHRYTSLDSKAHSFLLPLPNHRGHETLTKEAKFSSAPQEASKPLGGWEFLEECQSTHCGIRQKSLDLLSSADEFINHVEQHRMEKGNDGNHIKEPIESGYCPHVPTSSVPEELKLSLSINENKTRGTMVAFSGKKTSCSSQTVIDLEASAERMSDGYTTCTPYLGCAGLETNSKGKHRSQVSDLTNPIVSTCVKKDSFHQIGKNDYFQQHSECCQEQNFSINGIRDSHDDIPDNGLSEKEQQFISYQGGPLDLNKDLDDSCYSDDPIVVAPTAASLADDSGGLFVDVHEGTSPSIIWQKEVNKCSSEESDIVNKCSSEESDILQEDNRANFALVDLNSASETTEISTRMSNCRKRSAGMAGLMGPDSRSRHPVGVFECVGGCSSDHKNVELRSNPGNDVSHYSQQLFVTVGKASSNKNVEYAGFLCDHSQNEVRDQQGNKSPASCKSYSISDNDMSCGKPAHSCITTDIYNQYSKANLGSQVDVLSGERDLRLADSCDIKTECSDKKEEAAEVDASTQQAAESLIHMSLDNSACYQNLLKNAGSKEAKDDKREQPQYSFDSFELFTLQLTESNLTDDSASSKQLQVNDEETKHFGMKLRRGRRLKDFQKEILPGLVSLSVHEIREDINIMEGALRSREYRKTRAKMGNIGENWSPLARSRRSRRNHPIRRNSSRKLS